MSFCRKSVKSVCIFLAVLMLFVSVAVQALFAAMIDTEGIINSTRVLQTRDYINTAISNKDIQKALMELGINPSEAKARVNSLSDSEVNQIAERIDQLPAGAGALEAVVVGAVLVFLALLVTDVLGYTDVFPFVKK